MSNDKGTLFARYLPFWNKLSADEKEFLYRNTAEKKYRKGDIIHSGDDQCTGVLLVKKGQLRIYMLSDDGREITLYRLYPGETCTLSASCMLNEIKFDVFIDVQEESEIEVVNIAAIEKLSNENVFVENYIYKQTVSRFSDVMWAMQQILFMSFDKRLANFIIKELLKSEGSTIKLTHEQIAKYMGSAREVVTRMLKYFSDEGIVELTRGAIQVKDIKKLKKIVE